MIAIMELATGILRKLAYTSCEAPCLASSGQVFTTAGYLLVFAVLSGEHDQTCLSMLNLSAGALYLYKDGLGLP